MQFLAHPQPLMFVAGLGTADDETSPPPAATSPPPAPLASSPPSAFQASSGMSPSKRNAQPSTPERQTSFPSSAQDADFNTLIQDLRTTLKPYIHKPRVWLPPTERKRFRVELVDRNVQLPPKKATPERMSMDTRPPPPHSPLSPFTPGSPMHPDGLIAPVWVRKHAEHVPSVFVSFMKLYENPSRTGAGNSPLGEEMLVDAERQQERLADEALVQEMSELRKRLAERNVKLTVVLIASPQTLGELFVPSRALTLRLPWTRLAPLQPAPLCRPRCQRQPLRSDTGTRQRTPGLHPLVARGALGACHRLLCCPRKTRASEARACSSQHRRTWRRAVPREKQLDEVQEWVVRSQGSGTARMDRAL